MLENVTLDFERQLTNGNAVAVAEVESDNEQKASSILDNYLEENYPNYGREESHFNESGKYYFFIVE